MKRILKEPEFDTNLILDIEPETEEEPAQETIDDQCLFDTLDIYMIGATPLVRLTKKPEYTIFAVIIANIKKALALKKHINLVIKVLVEYYKYLDVFL